MREGIVLYDKQGVITSYSIHYTKLYDTTRSGRRTTPLFFSGVVAPGTNASFVTIEHSPIPGTLITSPAATSLPAAKYAAK